MPYEPNYKLILLFLTALLWLPVFIALIIRDKVKGNKFRPFYRAAWPFMVLVDLLLLAA